jgi:hypothetical protein
MTIGVMTVDVMSLNWCDDSWCDDSFLAGLRKIAKNYNEFSSMSAERFEPNDLIIKVRTA